MSSALPTAEEQESCARIWWTTCLINPAKHLGVLLQFQAAVPWMTTAAFIDEREALEWLINPAVAAAVKP